MTRQTNDEALSQRITANKERIDKINSDIESKRYVTWEETKDTEKPIITQIIFLDMTEEAFLASDLSKNANILYLLPEEGEED